MKTPKTHTNRRPFIIAIIAGCLIPLIFLVVSIRTMNDYGETTDEKASQISGSYYYYKWHTQKSVQDYIAAFSVKDRNYGPFVDTLSVASYDLLNVRSNIIPNPVAAYHVPAIVASVLALCAVYVFAYVNWGIMPAVLASLTLALIPRFIGDSQNNIKDTPIMALFALTLTAYYLAVTKRNLWWYITAGIFLGLTYATKINALIILPIILSWSFIYHWGAWRKFAAFIGNFMISLAASFVTILIAWPYYRYKPLERFVETYNVFKNHEWDGYVMYLGTHYRGHQIPRHYPFVMFGVTTPVFFLIFLFLAITALIILVIRRKKSPHISPLFLLVIWMLATPVIQASSPNPMYDGIRHFQASLAPMAILIAFGVWFTAQWIWNSHYKSRALIFTVFCVLCVIGYSSVLAADIRIHPYEIVYFNELTGGVKGAYRKFDLDYWGQSFPEAARWINTHLPTGSRLLMTNHMEYHFPIDQNKFTFVDKYPQYKINLVRGILYEVDTDDNYLYPRRKPIYEVKLDGVPLLQVFPIPENGLATEVSPATVSTRLMPGLTQKIYDNTNMADPPIAEHIAGVPSISCADPLYKDREMSVLYSGYIRIPHSDTYCFSANVDDEVIMKLNNSVVMIEPNKGDTHASLYLKAGVYRYQLEYTNYLAAACLQVLWSQNTCDHYEEIPGSVLFH